MNKTLEVFFKHLVNELNDRAGGGGGGSSYSSTTSSSYMRFGNSFLKDNRYEDAIIQFQKALDNSNTSDEKKEAYNMLAFSQRKLAGSLLDKSKENYIESLKLDSKYLPALEYYGELLIQMNQLTKSEDDKIDIFDIYETLQKNRSQPELTNDLVMALCGWKKNVSEGLNFFTENKSLNSFCTDFNNADLAE
jgi:tetratricopeptide (TPR) repeat protein